MKARTMIAIMALLAVVVALDLPAFSTAAFTSSNTSTGTVSAAADWTPPTVRMVDPGSPIKGTITITADASDAETGIASVTLQYLAPGGSSWASLCTTTVQPYSCTWGTAAVADGGYSLRAVATDNADYTAASEAVATTVANNVMAALSSPGEVIRGSVTLTASLVNAGSTSYALRVEYAVAGTGQWKTLCNNLVAPYDCAWATMGFANDYYDLRAAATANGTTTYSATVQGVLVDNTAPSITLADPGSPLSGVSTFAATATDTPSGVASVTLQYAAAGTDTWTTLCSITTSPFSCRYDTARIPLGSYDFRAIAVDFAGNSTTSAAVTDRLIDNTVSSISLEDPGPFLAGTVPLTANASSTAGVTSVHLQAALAGTGAWATVCTLTAFPYTCDWNSSTVADSLYDFRAMLVDGTTTETISAVVPSRRVDNTPLRGSDVQAVNGSTTPGHIENGDTLTFTYSEEADLATVTPGWNGAAIAVTLQAQDGNLLGLGHDDDTLTVLRPGSTVNLGSVNLRQNYIGSRKTVAFSGTMTASTNSVNGAARTVVTISLGAPASSTGLRTVSMAGSMVWTPDGAVTDLPGNSTSTTPVTEAGALDREF